MRAANLILSLIVGTVAVLTLGTIFVFGFQLLDPFAAAFGSPPASLGWEVGSLQILAFAGAGMVGLLAVLVIWLISGPIRSDRRQGFRR